MQQLHFPRPLAELEALLGHTFSNKNHLIEALTHKSFVHEWKGEFPLQSYERLEFLGDSLLNCWAAIKLFRTYPKATEGTLSRVRPLLVEGSFLQKISSLFEIPSFMLLGRGLQKRDSHQLQHLWGDAFEAILGAIYLDAGLAIFLDRLEFFYVKAHQAGILPDLDEKILNPGDPKTLFQEAMAKRQKQFQYLLLEERQGTPGEPSFHIALMVEQQEWGRRWGSSKKEAQRELAIYGLKKITEEFPC